MLLLEIAYTTPFDALVLPSDVAKGPGLAEWHAAKRLAQSITRELGTACGTMVRKCLRCNFGCDSDDSNNSDLQHAFHFGVVKELESLEEDLERLHI